MFFESKVRLFVEIPAKDFLGGDSEEEEVVKQLSTHMIGKILGTLGLCIQVVSVSHVSRDSQILSEEKGSIMTHVECHLLMFRPYTSEIIEGSISALDPTGIRVSLDFFNDVFIPLESLPQPCVFDPRSMSYTHQSKGGAVTLEKGDCVHCSVVRCSFNNPSSSKDGHRSLSSSSSSKSDSIHHSSNVSGISDDTPQLLAEYMSDQSMVVYAHMNCAGLGRPEWWTT